MSSGFGIIKRCLLGLAHIVLLALSLGWGVAHAQSYSDYSDYSEVSFEIDSVKGLEGTSLKIRLVRTGSDNPYSGAAGATVSVVGGGTAEEGSDYFFRTQNANWGEGEYGQSNDTIDITLFEDRDDESEETVILQIVEVSGDAYLGVPFELKIIIQNRPPPPNTEVQFQKDFYDGDEGEEVQVVLERVLASDGSLPVGAASAVVKFRKGSARSNDISLPGRTTVNWGAGDSTAKVIDIPLLDDRDLEGTENFFLEIDKVDGDAVLGGVGSTEIEIRDQYPGSLVYVGEPFEVVEDAVNNFVDIQVERVGGSAGEVFVVLGTKDSSARSGTDYELVGSSELNWSDGETGIKSVRYRAIQDSLTEGNETFDIVERDGRRNNGPGRSKVTIIDGAPPVKAGQVDFVDSVYSGSEADGSIVLTLRRSGGSDGDVMVSVNLVDVTATFPNDGSFPGSSNVATVAWSDGDAADKRVILSVEQDLDGTEGQERFDVTLSGPTNELTVGTANPTASVFIDDSVPPMPGFIAFDPEFYIVAEAGGQVTLTVTRTMGSDGDVSVDFNVVSGTGPGEATEGADFTLGDPANRTLKWGDGDSAPKSITFGIVDDMLFEGSESFGVNLLNPTGGAMFDSSSSVASVNITDNDPEPSPGTLSFVSDYTVSESMLPVSVEVARTGGSDGAVTAFYSLGGSGDSAEFGLDYGVSAEPNGKLFWDDGDSTSKFINIDIALDALVEGDEQFSVSIVDTTGMAELGDNSSEVTITDTPPPADEVRFLNATESIAEDGDLLRIQLQRSGSGAGDVEVFYQLVSGTATFGSDYEGACGECSSGIIFWPDGDLSNKTIDVGIFEDLLPEGDETFTVELSIDSSSGNVSLGTPNTTTITIIDVPPPMPGVLQFDPDVYSVAESDGLVELIVTRTGGTDGAASAAFEVIGDTAELGSDLAITEPVNGTLEWLAGDGTSRTITVDVASDALVEGSEKFTVVLSTITGSAAGGVTTAMVTLMDTTIPPVPDVIALVDASQTRLESEPMFELEITRTGNGIGDSSVDWLLSSASASLSDDIDLAEVTGTVSWADGQTGSQTVEIPIVNDGLDEADETLTLLLVNVQGASLGAPASSQLTIIDDDDEPPVPGSIQFTVDSINVDEDAGTVALTVTRTAGSDGPITAIASTVPGSAGAADFSAIQTVVSWDNGDTSTREIVVPIAFDTATESNESFSVILSGATPDDGVLGSPTTATVSINDVFNGSPGTVQFASGTASVDETDEALTVSVTRVGGTDGAISVNYSTNANTATAGDDFDNTSGTLSWADGDGAPKTFSIAIATDTLAEAAEQFSVTLDNATPAGIASIGTPGTLIVTINNVEPPPEPEPATMPGTVQFVSSAISNNESAGTVRVSVERVGGTDGAVSVRYDTVADSAVEGDDYQPASGRLQWADGEDDVKILSIAVIVDDNIEDDERFRMVLSDGQPVEEILGTPSSVEITIVDDSIAPPGVLAFVEPAVSVAESDEFVELQVARTGGSAGTVSVGYTTVERSADSTDFDPTSGRLSWDDGDTGIQTIRVPVNRDVLVEPIEQFQVVLAEAQPLGDAEQLGVSLATVSISDSTRLGTLGFLATEMSVSERDRSITLSVARSDGSDGDVSVDFATIGSSAEPGSDFVSQTGTLVWPDGDVEPRSITVLINLDNLVEDNEQFVVTLSNPQPLGGQQLGEAEATITIINATLADDQTTPPLAALGSLDLVVVSGDGQGGLPGDLLEPLVIDVVDLDDAGAELDGLPIRWRAVPEGSAELLDGGRTVSDESGRSSNRVRILSRGFLNVVATIDVASTAANGMTSRIRAPEFPVGQGEAVFTVRSGLFAADGLRNNQAAVGASLDAACEVLGVRVEQQQEMTAGEQDLFATCQELEARLTNGDGLAAALDRLLPEELFSIGDSVIDTTDIQVTNVYSRINAIRSGQVETLDVSGLQYRHYDQSIPGSVINAAQNELSGGGAAADGALGSSRLAFFANGSVSYGEVDGGENQSNAVVETTGLTLGIDYRATDNSAFGAGLGIIKNTTEFNPDAGTAEVSGLNLTLFGTYYKHQSGYVDAVLDIGRNSYDIKRQINLPNTPNQFGIGDTTADVLSFTVGAGRDFTRGPWEFGPYGRFSYIAADIDGYSERAAGSTEGFGSVLNVRAHSVRSTRLALGGQLARTISTTRAVFIPQLRLEAEFETEDKKEGIQATFQHDPTQTPFTVNGEDRDTSYFNLGIGSSAFFANGRSGFLFYETQLGNDRVTQHFLKLGVRLEF